MTETRASVDAELMAIDQSHLLAHFDTLSEADKSALLGQIAGLELERIPSLAAHARAASVEIDAELAEPVPTIGLNEVEVRAECLARGEASIRAGKVAAFTVAGGQGSRLGYEGPKGEYPCGPVSKMSLFAWFAEGVLAAQDAHGVSIPWYIMTSPLNHARTVEFFQTQDFFGLDPEELFFFPQGVLPTFSPQGKILLSEPAVVATNPDGHGGSLKALARSGALADMRRRGIEQISYFQVDNPGVRVVDPVFIGLHLDPARSSAEMSTKIVRKIEPDERVGVLGQVGGRAHVFEYSDLTPVQSAARTPTGTLRFDAANMAVHVLSVDFVERLNAGGDFALPLHRAVKRVAQMCDGETIVADAVKLETFVFDALPQCRMSAVLEADRVEEFAPIKNADGNDSPATSAALLTESAARFIEARGGVVPRGVDETVDATLELTPRRRVALADQNEWPDIPEGAAIQL